MTKQKILVFAAVFVIVTAMTGLVAADSVDIIDDTITYPSGGIGTSTVTVTNAGVWNTISVRTDNPNIEAKVTGGPSGPFAIETEWTSTYRASASYPAAMTYEFTVHVRGTDNEAGTVTVTNNGGTVYSDANVYDTVECGSEIHAPEFTTIALPVAAVLGLLFFFNYRKRKKRAN